MRRWALSSCATMPPSAFAPTRAPARPGRCAPRMAAPMRWWTRAAGGGGGTDDQTAAEVSFDASGLTGTLDALPDSSNVAAALTAIDGFTLGGGGGGTGTSEQRVESVSFADIDNITSTAMTLTLAATTPVAVEFGDGTAEMLTGTAGETTFTIADSGVYLITFEASYPADGDRATPFIELQQDSDDAVIGRTTNSYIRGCQLPRGRLDHRHRWRRDRAERRPRGQGGARQRVQPEQPGRGRRQAEPCPHRHGAAGRDRPGGRHGSGREPMVRTGPARPSASTLWMSRPLSRARTGSPSLTRRTATRRRASPATTSAPRSQPPASTPRPPGSSSSTSTSPRSSPPWRIPTSWSWATRRTASIPSARRSRRSAPTSARAAAAGQTIKRRRRCR